MVHWTTADGLPQNTINDIVVLPNGELWLATFGGLVRFNGAGFQVVDIARDEALASNRITSLVPADGDAAWFVTQEGHLGRLEGGRVRTLFGPAGPMRDVVGLVVAGSQFYAQTDGGSLWTSDGTQPWRPLMTAPQPGGGGPNFLARTNTDQAWASFDDRVVSLAPTGGVRPDALPVSAMAITGGAGSDLWLGLRGGVARYHGGRVDRLDIRPAIDTDAHRDPPRERRRALGGGRGHRLAAHGRDRTAPGRGRTCPSTCHAGSSCAPSRSTPKAACGSGRTAADCCAPTASRRSGSASRRDSRPSSRWPRTAGVAPGSRATRVRASSTSTSSAPSARSTTRPTSSRPSPADAGTPSHRRAVATSGSDGRATCTV